MIHYCYFLSSSWLFMTVTKFSLPISFLRLVFDLKHNFRCSLGRVPETTSLEHTECWGRVSKGFSPHPGLNCGPLVYETSVITTTPRKLRFSLEKKLQFSWFLHFSWNLVWFRSFKNLEQKMGAIFFLKWLKWIKPACFPPWKKFWNQILYYSFC